MSTLEAERRTGHASREETARGHPSEERCCGKPLSAFHLRSGPCKAVYSQNVEYIAIDGNTG